MTSTQDDLRPGFYWVDPVFDVDSDPESWMQKPQPAYWDGNEWHMLGTEEWAIRSVIGPVASLPVPDTAGEVVAGTWRSPLPCSIGCEPKTCGNAAHGPWPSRAPQAPATGGDAGLILALTQIANMGYAGAPDIAMRRIARNALAALNPSAAEGGV